MKRESKSTSDVMRPEYDLRGGVRGRYYKQYLAGTNVVLLDPDVAAVFHDSGAVNQALRTLMKAAGSIPRARSKSSRSSLH
jgi:hypothetical protein